MTPLSPTERPKLSARARLQADKVTGRPILLYPEGVLVLNATGEAIVDLCRGDLTLEEIISQLTAKYQAPADAVARDVIAYLDRLRAVNLLETSTAHG